MNRAETRPTLNMDAAVSEFPPGQAREALDEMDSRLEELDGAMQRLWSRCEHAGILAPTEPSKDPGPVRGMSTPLANKLMSINSRLEVLHMSALQLVNSIGV